MPTRQKSTSSKSRNTIFAEPETSTISFADPISKGELTTGSPSKSSNLSKASSKPLAGKKAKRLGNLNVDPDKAADTMRQFIDITQGTTDTVDIDDIDFDIGDTVDAPTPVPPTTPENLPVKISSDVLDVNGDYEDPKIDIYWHDIKDLPGYAINQIRGSFRPLLNSLMGNELEDLRLAATTDGSNSFSTMKKAISYIEKNGIKVDEVSLDIPGLDDYKVDKAIVYHLDKKIYIIALETFHGQQNLYIYEGDIKDSITGPQNNKPLELT